MADNFEPFSFGIENTMEMPEGSRELLSDLISPETSLENPENISPIVKETPPPTKEEEEKPKGKKVVPKEEEEITPQDTLSNFLNDMDEEEEEEEEEEKPTEKKPKEDPSQFALLYKDLRDLGVFDQEEEAQVNTPEEFLEQFKQEKQKGGIQWVENFISRFGEDYQRAFEAIYVKGVNPKDYFTTYNNIVSFAEMDLSKEQNQETVLRQALSDQGWDPEDIESEVERIKNYGDLESTAQKHHKVLVRKEAQRLQQMEAKAQEDLQRKEALHTQYMQNVQGTIAEKLKNKEFDGIPLNPRIAAELQDFLLTDKWQTSTGEPLTDFDKAILDLKKPENHQMKVKIALLMKMLEKDPTLSTIQKAGVTKKSNNMFTHLAKQKDEKISSSSSSWSSLNA